MSDNLALGFSMHSLPKLFTYTIPEDDGAAPNPFRGMCTLAICKPGIRKAARVGDWVAGFGAVTAPGGDLSGRMVYTMRVDEVLSLQEYDARARTEWPHRIPSISSPDLSERLGDCIYDYSSGEPIQRPGVHNEGNQKVDLSGENVLISRNFYYFGGRAIGLPPRLHRILHQTQGFKSHANDGLVIDFLSWMESLKLTPGQMFGWPGSTINWKNNSSCGGCIARTIDGLNDSEY